MESWNTRGGYPPRRRRRAALVLGVASALCGRRRSLAANTTPGSPGATGSALLVRLLFGA